MTQKTFFIRFAGLVLIALAGLPVFAAMVNVLVMLNVIPQELAGQPFGTVMTQKAMFIWIGCLPLAFAAIFSEQRWARIFYFSPLYAPALFGIIFTAIQN